MIEENGGNIIWVKRAWNHFFGYLNGCNGIGFNLASQAMLLLLSVKYIPIDFTPTEVILIKIALGLLVAIINILGADWVSNFSSILVLIVNIPFLSQFYFIYGPYAENHTLGWHSLTYTPQYNEVHWGVFISTAIWCCGGFDSMGGLAAEVKGGKRTFVIAILVVFPLLFLNYWIPIFNGVLVEPDFTKWGSGYFTTVAYKISNFVGLMIVIASIISNVGQYLAVTAPTSRNFVAMSENAMMTKRVFRASFKTKDGTYKPVIAIALTIIFSVGLSLLPVNFLVQIVLVLRTINLAFEYTALIRLRMLEPNSQRPYKVPFGIAGCVALATPTFIICIFNFTQMSTEVLISGVLVEIAFVVGYILFYPLRRKLFPRKRSYMSGESVETANLLN